MGFLVYLNRNNNCGIGVSFSLILGVIFTSGYAFANDVAGSKVLASWVCEGESIGLHRQINGADGVFSDYVPLEAGAEVHFLVSNDGHEGLSIHTENEEPQIISNVKNGNHVLRAQSPDRFNEHFWAYKANYSFELYKEKSSPKKFHAYEISTSFYDTLEGETRLKQFTRLYECERVKPMDAERLLVVHRSPKQNYTCLKEPFQVQRDNRISVNGKKQQITFSSVDIDRFSSVASSKKHIYRQILRKSRYNMYLLKNDDVFAINPTSLIGVRIVNAEVQDIRYRCVLD